MGQAIGGFSTTTMHKETMRKIILQFCTEEQAPLLTMARQYNETYAKKMGYEYMPGSGRYNLDRSMVWEKIAYINKMLPKFEDGSLVVWEDADSINIKNECFSTALPEGGIYGMVQNRGGINKSQLVPWFNSGVIVMKNCPVVRDFLKRVWVRTNETDEQAIMAELKHNGFTIGNGVKICTLDHKWNRWSNNEHLCKPEDTVVQSFHGVKDKLPKMKNFLK